MYVQPYLLVLRKLLECEYQTSADVNSTDWSTRWPNDLVLVAQHSPGSGSSHQYITRCRSHKWDQYKTSLMVLFLFGEKCSTAKLEEGGKTDDQLHIKWSWPQPLAIAPDKETCVAVTRCMVARGEGVVCNSAGHNPTRCVTWVGDRWLSKW